MANERKTENLVRDLLRKKGYYDDDNIHIEEQSSDNPKIDKLLKSASKSGTGKGYPEFIITFTNNPNNIIVIECKADISKHESKDRKQYKDYAVDGVLLYAAHLKDQFNVVAIAVSGQTEHEMKISHHSWIKDAQKPKDSKDTTILTPQSVFKGIDKQLEPIREEELIKTAIEYNKTLSSFSVPERDRCTLISSILVALRDNAFRAGYAEYFQDIGKDDNPNEGLIEGLIIACKNILGRHKILDERRDIIMRSYEGIKQVKAFTSKTITIKNKSQPNRVLKDLIDDLEGDIIPRIHNNAYDVLGQFYTEFIRYAGNDSKTGLVLTPPHITDLFCDLARINKDDIVFDPCCGTGGFLVSAMKYMLNKSGNDSEKHNKIKSKQLIGVEQRADMFAHACSNMMMRGDGKSSIYFGDCFDEKIKIKIKRRDSKPTKVFLNPPYDVGKAGQLQFIENAMECIPQGGICIAICQMSVAISSDRLAIEVKKRLLVNHTLKAVLSMPDDLFHPAAGVITCIIIFEAHSPHPELKETFFGYYKDDGFVKTKYKGRVDSYDKWKKIKENWLYAYDNNKTIAGLSLTKCVSAEDEWCAEAYMETDYSKIMQEDFEEVVKKYALFNLMNGGTND